MPRASESYRVVLVTAERSIAPEIESSLAETFETFLVETIDEAEPLLPHLHALLLDLDGPDGTSRRGLQLLQILRSRWPELLLVALTRSTSRTLPARAGAAGADWFFAAPVDFQEVRVLLQKALEKKKHEREHKPAPQAHPARTSFFDLIGVSEPMQRVYDAIRRVMGGSTTVVIRGPSGSGKELVARAIVAGGPRKEKPFISINCAALPENLIEAELFGHEKGAFTGAHAARAGHIEMAHGGTLFLDEITTLDLSLQSKLLRVLEQRTVQRIGGYNSKRIDFRLLTATNDDVEELVRTGRFREDLYYRIHVFPIFLPPLAEREGDLPLLVDYFIRLHCGANGVPPKHVDPEALEVLEEYSWPGNVRELENVIQRLVLMVEGPTITVKHLPPQILYSSTLRQESLLIPEEGINFDDEMRKIEITYLQAALRRTKGVKMAAAELLRLDPRRLGYLCRKYRIP